MFYTPTTCNMFAKCIKTCMASKWHQLLKVHTTQSSTMIHDDKQKNVAEGDSAGEAGTPMLNIDLNDDVFRAMMPSMQSTDSSLEHAANMAAYSGSATPLLKEELRCSIQLRLLSSGKDLSDTSSDGSASPSPGLTPQEEEKVKRRRERNKEAAQRCRKRKRDLAEGLQVEINQLEFRNKELKSAVEKLLDEKSSLVTLLKRHDKTTQCDTRFTKT